MKTETKDLNMCAAASSPRPKSRRVLRKDKHLKKKADGLHKSDIHSRCPGCGILEQSVTDIELNSGWIACNKCKSWFHEVCAEANGVFDDDFFICGECVE